MNVPVAHRLHQSCCLIGQEAELGRKRQLVYLRHGNSLIRALIIASTVHLTAQASPDASPLSISYLIISHRSERISQGVVSL